MDIQPIRLDQMPPGDGFLQTPQWGAFKEHFGWKASPFLVDGKPLLVLIINVSSSCSLAYIPKGPEGVHPSILQEYFEELVPYLPREVFVIRFDLPLPRQVDFPKPFIQALRFVQPQATVTVDLRKPAEQLLKEMKQRTRYSIKQGRKNGVTVEEVGVENLETWYNLTTVTGQRNGISFNSLDYYKKVMALGDSNKDISTHLVFANVHGKPYAGNILVRYKGTAISLYGAASSEYRNIGISALLNWESILLCQSFGDHTYDFWGISRELDKKDPLHGLYVFKTGFGGNIIQYPGTWDYPVRPYTYHTLKRLEIFRRRVRKVVRKIPLIGKPKYK